MDGVTFIESMDGVTAAQLSGGFWVGWPSPPDPQAHLRLLRGSAAVVLAREDASEQIVGFITAVSDGVLAAYIPLLEVLPAWQGRGIGSELVLRMLEQLRRFYVIDLLCDPALQRFYARLGMRPAVGMLLRNYHRQSGV